MYVHTLRLRSEGRNNARQREYLASSQHDVTFILTIDGDERINKSRIRRC